MPDIQDYKKDVYDNLVHAYGKEAVPDEVTFYKKIENASYVKDVHDNLVHAYGDNEVPSIDDFNKKISSKQISGLKSYADDKPKVEKKEPTTVMAKMFGETKPDKSTGDISQYPRVLKKEQNTIMPELQMQMNAKKEGVDITLAKWAKQNKIDINSPKAKEQRKKYENGLSNGDYILTLDADGNRALGRNAGPIDSYIIGLRQTNKDIDESKVYKQSSDEELVNILNKKMSEPEEIIPTVSRGLLNEFSLAAGGATRMVGKQGLGTSLAEGAALLLAPETGGLSLAVIGVLGGSTAMAKDMMDGAYKSEIEKYYKQGKDEGLSDLEAIKRARTQGERASLMSIPEILGFSVAGRAVGKIFPGVIGNDGLKTGFGQALKKIAPEVIGTSMVASGSALAKDLSAKQLGYKVEAKTMLDDVLNAATDNVKFMAGLMSVHGVANKLTSMSKPLYSQLKSYVNSANKGVPETVLNNLAENGVITPEQADITVQTLKSNENAKDSLAPLGVTDEALAGALQGKQEKKMNLQKDIEELQKQNVTIGIAEKQAEIAKIDEEMKSIYETGKIDEFENDSDIPDFEPTEPTENKQNWKIKEDLGDGRVIVIKENGSEITINKSELETPIKEEVKVETPKTVEQLRAEEQAEYDAMTDPNDEVKRKEIYDKYDELITPLLEKQKAEFKPTEENIQANLEATPEQRIEAEKQARLAYEEELKTKQDDTTGSTGEDTRPTIEVSTDVLRELGEKGRKLTDFESGEVKSKVEELGGNDAARKLYETEGNSEYGESYEVFILRKLC